MCSKYCIVQDVGLLGKCKGEEFLLEEERKKKTDSAFYLGH